MPVNRPVFISITVLLILLISAVGGCDKERIVTTTEYIENTEYIELPPDTVLKVDTVYSTDSITVTEIDTLFVSRTDTVVTVDTVIEIDYVYDTVTIHDTTTVHDTVEVVQHHYDTTVLIDTVELLQQSPNVYLAIAAMQYYSDPLVFDLIQQEFGISGGWVFYLSTFQSELTAQSSDVYDIYGYIDYWTEDWSSYYPLEYYWRLTYIGGDPADPDNWQMSEPTGTTAVSGRPGLKVSTEASPAYRTR
jgi:hypothetical protein